MGVREHYRTYTRINKSCENRKNDRKWERKKCLCVCVFGCFGCFSYESLCFPVIHCINSDSVYYYYYWLFHFNGHKAHKVYINRCSMTGYLVYEKMKLYFNGFTFHGFEKNQFPSNRFNREKKYIWLITILSNTHWRVRGGKFFHSVRTPKIFTSDGDQKQEHFLVQNLMTKTNDWIPHIARSNPLCAGWRRLFKKNFFSYFIKIFYE